MMGYCTDGHPHAPFMRGNCADACEKAASVDPNAGVPPPFGFSTLMITAGFGAAVAYAVRYAVQRDGSRSHTVRKKMLDEDTVVGPGKPNKSAVRAPDGAHACVDLHSAGHSILSFRALGGRDHNSQSSPLSAAVQSWPLPTCLTTRLSLVADGRCEA